MTTTINGSSPSITFSDGSAQTSATRPFQNRIINGAMVIDQRNAGASVTLTSSGVYTVDRFVGIEDTDGVMTAQQDTSAPTGFINSVKLTTTTADGTLGATQHAIYRQSIEGTNVYDLGWGTASAKTVTLSFWVRSSLTGTFGGALGNSAFNRSYPFTYSISVADTWEYKTVTIAGDTSGTWLTTNGVGVRVDFGLGVGSTYSGTAGAWAGSGLLSATGATSVIGTLNATWFVTGCQLEVGSTATSFDYRPYGTELALCQRYCYVTGGSAYSNLFSGFFNTTTDFQGPVVMPVTMRSSPTLTTTGNFQVISNSAFSASSLTLGASETTQMTAKINGTVSGATAGYGGTMRANNDTTAKLILSAEL